MVPVSDPGVGEGETDQPGTVGGQPPHAGISQGWTAGQVQVGEAGWEGGETEVTDE